jgi:PIN domain nuclease of toxin-antitoxin system
MKIAAVADTHAVLWYIYAAPELSKTARTLIENSARNGEFIGVSAISLAEIVYLVEKGKVRKDAYRRLTAALQAPDNVLTELALTSQIVDAMWLIPYRAVPDFPDRIIAATAKQLGVPVISRDHKIVSADVESIW